jgi:hypothetical protein
MELHASGRFEIGDAPVKPAALVWTPEAGGPNIHRGNKQGCRAVTRNADFLHGDDVGEDKSDAG